MTSMPASRRARAITLAPRSWPSRPGLATRTRILRSEGIGYDFTKASTTARWSRNPKKPKIHHGGTETRRHGENENQRQHLLPQRSRRKTRGRRGNSGHVAFNLYKAEN